MATLVARYGSTMCARCARCGNEFKRQHTMLHTAEAEGDVEKTKALLVTAKVIQEQLQELETETPVCDSCRDNLNQEKRNEHRCY